MRHIFQALFPAVTLVCIGKIVTGQLFILGGVFMFVAQLLMPRV